MIHVFTWGLLIIAIGLSVCDHIVTVVVVVGWVCFMVGLYLGPL